MVADLGGARAPEARQQGRPGLRRVLARDARGQHGHRLHADDRAAAGGAAARRRRRAAGKHGHPRRHAERGAHGGHVGRIPNARRRPRPRHRGAVVWRPHRRWHRALRRAGCEMGARRNQPHTLYESVIRAGEMAQRMPKGPIFLNVALEHMLHDWTPPAAAREVPPAPIVRPRQEDVAKVAELVRNSKNPVIVTETAGRDPKAFSALVELADLLAIAVINGRVNAYANFPTNHPLYLGMGRYKAVDDADLVLLVGARAPWYPPRRRPTSGKIVAVHDNPLQDHMVYQTLHADYYLEGDIAESLTLLIAATKSVKIDAATVNARRQRWTREHENYVSELHAAREKAQNGSAIDPLSLLGT